MRRLPMRSWHVAPRLAAASIILDSGLRKQRPDPGQAERVHGLAAQAYPFLARVDPDRFLAWLARGEVVLGAALVLPVVPSGVVGAGLTAFSLSLLGLYARVPGMRRPGSLRPEERGRTIVKDVWLLGIGAGLAIEAMVKSERTPSSATRAVG